MEVIAKDTAMWKLCQQTQESWYKSHCVCVYTQPKLNPLPSLLPCTPHPLPPPSLVFSIKSCGDSFIIILAYVAGMWIKKVE